MNSLRLICPLCEKKTGNALKASKDHAYCRRCQLAWIKHFPHSAYDEHYYKGASTLAGRLFSPIGTFFYKLRNLYVFRSTRKLWIDVGAGDGAYLENVPAMRKLGIEISKSGRAIMRRKGIVTMSEKKFLKTKGLNANVISFWQVLEHVENPWDYLSVTRKNIAENGLLVIGVPNINSFEYKMFGKYWFHLAPKFHLWHFTPRSLGMLLRKNGFTIKSIDHWSLEHHPTGVLQSFINATAKSDAALHRFIKRGHDYTFSLNDAFWSFFWLTVGLPIILSFWITGALFKKGGTIVVVASPSKPTS